MKGKINEFMDGDFIYANVFMSPYIFKIDGKIGIVLWFYDLRNLEQDMVGIKHEVWKGIFHIKDCTFYIIGKYFPGIIKMELD